MSFPVETVLTQPKHCLLPPALHTGFPLSLRTTTVPDISLERSTKAFVSLWLAFLPRCNVKTWIVSCARNPSLFKSAISLERLKSAS